MPISIGNHAFYMKNYGKLIQCLMETIHENNRKRVIRALGIFSSDKDTDFCP